MSAALPLSSLSIVDWASLEHSRGSAEDVPDMLRALLAQEPEERDDARDALLDALDHQGVQRWEATLRAVPFLIGLLGDRATPERGAIARMLAELAVGDTCWFLHEGFHPVHQTEQDGSARPQASSVIESTDFVVRAFPSIGEGHDMSEGSGLRWIYDAIVAGVPTYLDALRDADEDLRRSLPFLFAFLPVKAKTLSRAMLPLLDDPQEPVRASAALGLSHVTTRAPKSRALVCTALEGARARRSNALERRCIALALVRLAPTPAVRDELRAAIGEGPIEREPSFPWTRIDSPPFLFCTTFLGTPREDRAEVIAAACSALAKIDDVDDAADLATWIAKLAIPPSPRAVAAASLSPLAAAAVRALAASPAAWHYNDTSSALDGRGVPTTLEGMRQLAASL